MAGITVVDSKKDAKAELYIYINGFKTYDDKLFIIGIDFTVSEFVYYAWRLKDKLNFADTYSDGNVYKIPTKGLNDNIRSFIKDLTDNFINKYLAANPK